MWVVSAGPPQHRRRREHPRRGGPQPGLVHVHEHERVRVHVRVHVRVRVHVHVRVHTHAHAMPCHVHTHVHAMPCLLAVWCLSLIKVMISDLARVLACRYDMLRSCGLLLVVTVVWHPDSVIVADLADAWHGLTSELELYLDMF